MTDSEDRAAFFMKARKLQPELFRRPSRTDELKQQVEELGYELFEEWIVTGCFFEQHWSIVHFFNQGMAGLAHVSGNGYWEWQLSYDELLDYGLRDQTSRVGSHFVLLEWDMDGHFGLSVNARSIMETVLSDDMETGELP